MRETSRGVDKKLHDNNNSDSSIYEAMVNLAQDFSTRYPLIDMHGNVGSLDGDPAAAMRYTESRLTAIADEAMKDIEKNTVAMTNNFDGTVLEPTALPTLLPLIFMNGSEGIAVGMATKMPPHNLTEILDAADYIIAELLEGRDADPEEIFKIIKGPDFPLGAVIVGKTGIRDAFFTGKGQISVRSEYEIEELGNSSSRIAISSIPYQVNKSNLVDKIDSLRKTTIPEIKEVRDESDKDGIRICIDLKRDVNAQLIVNKLMKHTQLQANFNVNNTVIVDKKPESVGTIDMLQHYIAHCIDVITRRSVFDHEKASARFNIVSGILWAINPDVLDNVIHAIRAAKGTEEAISAIMNLSDEINEEQAKAIAEMKLRQLTTDNEDKYTSERDLLSENIQRLTEIIENSSVMLTTLRSELSTLKDRFGDARRTKIIAEEGSNDELDCIEDETLVITFSTSGIIKSVEEKEYRSTNRGAKGVKTAEIKENDAIKAMMTVGSKEDILFFTNLGRCHVLKAYKIQKTSRTARGKSVNNYLNLEADEVIVSLLTADLSDKQNSFALVTKNGIIKRLSFENMSTRRTVTKVMNFKDNDMLIAVQTLTDEEDILLTSACGMSIRFKGSDVRMSGRTAEGVKAINLREHDYVVDAVKVIDGQMLLTITQFGMGKKTKVKDYTLQSRAGKGIITHKLNENTGELVCANIVNDDDEIFIATAKGQIVRVDAQNISTYGRSTIGVKVVSLAEDDYIIAVSEARKENEEAEEGN